MSKFIIYQYQQSILICLLNIRSNYNIRNIAAVNRCSAPEIARHRDIKRDLSGYSIYRHSYVVSPL